MSANKPLYLGFDLSTQQLKAVAITSDLDIVYAAKVDFDLDLPTYGTNKGVYVQEEEEEVFAPIAMWLEAVDLLLDRLRQDGMAFDNVKGISGAGQQHGSVFWTGEAEQILRRLNPSKSLVSQISDALASPWSPNWQDASTQAECDAFNACLGSPEELAHLTGSRAHHRFTGPQILRFRNENPEAYERTERISLVSSFLASVFLGRIAEIDISDVCGINLWDITAGAWSEPLVRLAGGGTSYQLANLKRKLGHVRKDGGGSMGSISPWFVLRYGFNSSCAIAPFTGDNSATLCALPLRPLDTIVSLGTSTTFLMVTQDYIPDQSYHFFCHPTSPDSYMFMLCYKNGSLARERVRDSLGPCLSSKESAASTSPNVDPWTKFNDVAISAPPLGRKQPSDPAKLGLYFPLPEIVPDLRSGTWRFTRSTETSNNLVPVQTTKGWNLPWDDARAILESQALSIRLRSRDLMHALTTRLPPQPLRIYLAGGGSLNPAIARVVGEVLGGAEGVYKLEVGGNTCALGPAQKATWSIERAQDGQEGQVPSFTEWIGKRWKEDGRVTKVDVGYRPEVWEVYKEVLNSFEHAERVAKEG